MTLSTAALGQTVEVREADDIVADAIDLLATRLPEWIPRNGSLEVIYLEAVAVAAGEAAAAANAEVGAVVEAILTTMYGVARLPGTTATGDLTLTFDTTVTTVLPTGTSFLLPDYDVELLSTADVTVTATTTATVPVQTASPTSAVNGLTSTAAVDVLDAIPNALTVVIDGTLTGGSDPESDTAYIARAQNRLARVTSSLVVVDHFAAYVLEDGRASNAVGIGAWDGTLIATAGTDGGHVTVACYGRGAQLSSDVRTELAAAMQPLTAAGITVHVNEADLTTVDVTVTVTKTTGADSATVQAACEAALTDWLAPETWTFGADVIKNDIIVLLGQVEGVASVGTPSAPAADVTIPIDGLPTPGTLTITVV